ncbi:hypothetical protein PTKIN_Ptkin05aG0149900 [Pterospermum kingtungense]
MSVLEALFRVHGMGYSKVVFESDAKEVVEAIYLNREDNSEFGSITSCYRRFLTAVDGFSVCYVRWKANGVAHVLARHS